MFDLFIAAAENATAAAANATAAAASAGNPPASQPNPLMSILPFIVIFAVMIFFMNRSQKKQLAKRQEMMNKVTRGTGVWLTSGIYGKVDEVRDEEIVLEIADGVKIKVNKAGIGSIDAPEAK